MTVLFFYRKYHSFTKIKSCITLILMVLPTSLTNRYKLQTACLTKSTATKVIVYLLKLNK